jgi:hypothetical protein
MKALKGFLKPDGLFYLGVPTGVDTLLFNAYKSSIPVAHFKSEKRMKLLQCYNECRHRVYGPIRYPMLTEGWEILGRFDENVYPENFYDAGKEVGHPVAVLQIKR